MTMADLKASFNWL